jgi:hypothetical protein
MGPGQRSQIRRQFSHLAWGCPPSLLHQLAELYHDCDGWQRHGFGDGRGICVQTCGSASRHVDRCMAPGPTSHRPERTNLWQTTARSPRLSRLYLPGVSPGAPGGDSDEACANTSRRHQRCHIRANCISAL